MITQTFEYLVHPLYLSTFSTSILLDVAGERRTTSLPNSAGVIMSLSRSCTIKRRLPQRCASRDVDVDTFGRITNNDKQYKHNVHLRGHLCGAETNAVQKKTGRGLRGEKLPDAGPEHRAAVRAPAEGRRAATCGYDNAVRHFQQHV